MNIDINPSRPKFRVWDKWNSCFFKPTYEAYKGNLEELLLSPMGHISIRRMHSMDSESLNPDRFILNLSVGLQDCNHKEIFSGDILKSEIYDTCNNYIIEDITHFHYLMHDLLLHMDDIEVIGNIYENADLLKEENK